MGDMMLELLKFQNKILKNLIERRHQLKLAMEDAKNANKAKSIFLAPYEP